MKPSFEIRVRTLPARKSWPEKKIQEIFRDGKPLEAGEGPAEFQRLTCENHGENSPHITGYNQGGHDWVNFCLLCCRELLDTGMTFPEPE